MSSSRSDHVTPSVRTSVHDLFCKKGFKSIQKHFVQCLPKVWPHGKYDPAKSRMSPYVTLSRVWPFSEFCSSQNSLLVCSVSSVCENVCYLTNCRIWPNAECDQMQSVTKCRVWPNAEWYSTIHCSFQVHSNLFIDGLPNRTLSGIWEYLLVNPLVSWDFVIYLLFPYYFDILRFLNMVGDDSWWEVLITGLKTLTKQQFPLFFI